MYPHNNKRIKSLQTLRFSRVNLTKSTDVKGQQRFHWNPTVALEPETILKKISKIKLYVLLFIFVFIASL